jgi:hypothetical protein
VEAPHGGFVRIRADLRDLLIFIVAMSVVLAALLVIISRMPNDNPLKRILVALSYRVGATAAAGMLVIPATPIPGLDAIVDFGAPLALIWYWFTFSATRAAVRRGTCAMRSKGQRLSCISDPARAGGPRLHQFLGTTSAFNEVAEILAPDFRTITYDKRGHGLSESGPDQNDMANYARDLAALLDQVGVGRATIVGLSIGGMIAQEFYRHHPDRVATLVLCDTAAKIGTERFGTNESLRSSAAALNPWPIPSSSGGSPPISDPGDPPSLPACAPCSRERRAKAILPLAAP